MAALRDTKHVEWARAFIALLEELRVYVMEFHTTGLVWNAKVRRMHQSLCAIFNPQKYVGHLCGPVQSCLNLWLISSRWPSSPASPTSTSSRSLLPISPRARLHTPRHIRRTGTLEARHTSAFCRELLTREPGGHVGRHWEGRGLWGLVGVVGVLLVRVGGLLVRRVGRLGLRRVGWVVVLRGGGGISLCARTRQRLLLLLLSLVLVDNSKTIRGPIVEYDAPPLERSLHRAVPEHVDGPRVGVYAHHAHFELHRKLRVSNTSYMGGGEGGTYDAGADAHFYARAGREGEHLRAQLVFFGVLPCLERRLFSLVSTPI